MTLRWVVGGLGDRRLVNQSVPHPGTGRGTRLKSPPPLGVVERSWQHDRRKCYAST